MLIGDNKLEKSNIFFKYTYKTYPSVRIIDLVSQTTYVVCVNIIHKRWDLQFKVDSERQIFWETVLLFYLLLVFLPEICWEEIAEEILLIFCFWCLAWSSYLGFTSNKLTHYLLDYGDFNIPSINFTKIDHLEKVAFGSRILKLFSLRWVQIWDWIYSRHG